MYIELGPDAVIKERNIIGIFDLDTSTVSKKTRDYLNKAEKEGNTVTVSLYDLPRTFTVAAKDKNEQKIYISPLTVKKLSVFSLKK